MPQPTFRGDPYRVLGLTPDASDAAIKRRWRQLAREHHPDRAADPVQAEVLNRRMARINAAYDVLRDPERRARLDSSGGRAAPRPGPPFTPEPDGEPAGPPRPRPTRPVTARFDTSPLAHRRNSTTGRGRPTLNGHPPIGNRERRVAQEPLRASDPCGPVMHRRHGGSRQPRLPSLADARATELAFGKFRGLTLGEVEQVEPTYIDWIAQTITRDHDLVVRARVIRDDMDERGVERRIRRPTSGFGFRAEPV